MHKVGLASNFVSQSLANFAIRQIATAIDYMNESGMICLYPDSITLKDGSGGTHVFPFIVPYKVKGVK